MSKKLDSIQTIIQVEEHENGGLVLWIDLKDIFARYGLTNPVIRSCDVNPRANNHELSVATITVD